MSDLVGELQPFATRLAELVEQHGGPGASVAVGRGKETFTAAAGIANLNTGLEVRPETRFLIGSNTKALTIALVCRAADDGLLDLDGKVKSYLPDFETADPITTAEVTVRNLLLHNSGIGGDFFRDFGRGDDAMARLVAALPEAGVAHPVGMTWAYSNAAYVVAGRILEVLHGRPFAAILRERLLAPLRMGETCLTPEESILVSTAVGHQPGPDGSGLQVTGQYLLPHAMAPAGSIVNATARDMVKFGRLFLDRGCTAEGERLLTESRVAEMLTPAVRIPRPLTEHHMTLLMVLEEREGRRRYMSGGATTGQGSYFFLLPDHDAVLVGLGNGPGAGQAIMTIFEEITQVLTGWEPLAPPERPASLQGLDLAPFEGRFESPGAVIEATAKDGGLEFSMFAKASHQEGNRSVFAVEPIGNDEFLLVGAPSGCKYFRVGEEPAEYLWMHSVYRRTA